MSIETIREASQGRVRSIVKMADQSWTCDQIKGGLSSGEGFIEAVRDPVERYDAKEKRFEVVAGIGLVIR
jgi:hypothetical protein